MTGQPEQAKPRKRRVRRVLLALAVCLLCLPVITLGALQTGPGRRAVCSWTERITERLGYPVRVAGLGGWVPLRMTAERVTVHDGLGAWLTFEQVRVSVSFAALLRGRLCLLDVHAQHAAFDRAPYQEPVDNATAEPFRLPRIPPVVTRVRVDALGIDQISVGPALLGFGAEFTLAARFTPEGGRQVLAAHAARTDAAGTALDVEAALDVDGRLRISAHARDDALIGALSEGRARQIELRAEGDGPLEQWAGGASVSLDGVEAFTTQLSLTGDAGLGVRATGLLNLHAPLIPEALAERLGPEAAFTLAARWDGQAAAVIDTLTVRTANARFDASAAYALDAGTARTRADAEVPAMSAVTPLPEGLPDGPWRVSMTCEGAPGALHGEASLHVADAAWADAAYTVGLGDPITVRADVRAAENAASLPEQLRAIAGAMAHVDMAYAADGTVTSRASRVALGGAELTLDGTARPADAMADMAFRLDVPDMAALAQLAGLDAGGQVTIDGRAAGAASLLEVTTDITGNALRYGGDVSAGSTQVQLRAESRGWPAAPLEQLSATGSARIEQLAAAGQAFAALDVALAAEAADLGTVHVSRLEVTDGNSRVEMTGTVQPRDRHADGRLTLAVADLAAWNAAAGRVLGGALDAEAAFSGAADALHVEATAAIRGLVVDAVAIERVEATARVDGLPHAPQGEAALQAASLGETLDASVVFARADTGWAIAPLRVESGANSVTGSARIAPDSGAVHAELHGGLPDLAVFGRLLDEPLAGRVTFDAQVALAGETVSLTATAAAAGIESAYVRAAAVDLDAEMSGSLAEPAGSVQLTARELGAGDAHVDELEAALDAAGGTAAWTARARGAYLETRPFDLAVAAETAGAGGGLGFERVSVSRLEGTWAGIPLSLAGALTAARDGGAWTVDGAGLNVGGGQITMDRGRYGPEAVALDAAVRDFPLGLAAAFGGPVLEGTLDAAVSLRGTPGAPEATAQVTLRNPRMPALGDAPPLTLAAEASLANGSLRAQAELTTDGATHARGSAELPARFRLAPVDFGIDAQAEVAADGEAVVELARVPQWLGLAGHALAGTLTADMRVSGRLDAPKLAGEARIAEGRYENETTSTILDQLALLLRAEGNALTLERFTATDGAQGVIEARGHATLDAAAQAPFEFETTLRQARLVNRDDVTAQVDGAFSARGTIEDILVQGKFTLAPAQVRLPDRLPPSYAKIDVVEVDGNATPAEAAPEPAPPFLGRIRLDVQCDVPRRLFVRAAALDSEWHGQIAVSGTAAQPRVLGELTVLRGTLSALDRSFRLDNSRITLDGSYPPDPYLQLTATTRAGDLDAQINLTGSQDDLAFEITSDPARPEDEVLAQLLFGRNLDEITPVQALHLARTAQMLRGAGGMALLSGGSQLPGIDRFEVKQGDSLGDVSVGVGKYLTEEIYVEVEQGVGLDSGKVLVNLELTPQLNVKGESGAAGRSSAGLFWERDY